MNRGLWQLALERAAATPDATMLVDEHDRTVDFRTFVERAERVAAALVDRGVGPGVRVSWQLPTSIDGIVLCVALARLGAVQNPILAIYRERELAAILGQFRPKLLIANGSLWGEGSVEALGALVEGLPDCALVIHEEGLEESDPARLSEMPPPRDENAIRWVLNTSGTTSAPKGVQHTDASLGAGAEGMNAALQLCAEDRLALVFPFAHVGGIGTLFCQLLAGFGVILSRRFEPDRTPALLARHGLTVASGGTAITLLLLDHQRKSRERLFPHMRIAVASTAPKSTELHERVRRELGGDGVFSCYGLTEAPFTTFSAVGDPDEKLAFTEGRPPKDFEIRIVDEQGATCDPGVSGEIRLRGPQVFAGYLDEAANAEAFDESGFFRTGDLGQIVEAGYLMVTGRIKDLIIRKGENISAKEIEDVLVGCESVDDAAVVGLPDDVLGERCCAVLVPRDPDRPPSEEELLRHCEAARLARQKLPERWEIVAALPRNATGKVLKQELRERYSRS